MKKLLLTIIAGIIAVSSYSQFNLIKAISWPLVCGQPILAGFNVRIPTEDSAFYYYSIGKCSPSSYADNKIYRADSSFHNNFTIFTSNTIEGYLIKLVSCPNGHCCYNYCETGYNITTLKKYLTSSGWSNIGSPSNLFNMQFLNDHNGFAITSTGLFYRYKNDTLSALYTIPSCYDPRINFKNLNVGFIVCKDTVNGVYNKILKTTDNGSSWTTILHNSIDTLSYLRFINDSCFLLITHERAVYKSTNQGLSWNYLLQIPSNIAVYSFVNDSIVFGLSGWNIMKTTNAGTNWNNIQTIAPIGNFGGLESISMLNDSVGYVIGTGTSTSTPMSQWKIIYKTTNGGMTFTENLNLNKSLKIFPNPTDNNCKITIPAEFKIEAKLSIQIFDNLGKLVKEDQVESIINEINIDLSQNPKGIYTVVLKDDKISYNSKIIIK